MGTRLNARNALGIRFAAASSGTGEICGAVDPFFRRCMSPRFARATPCRNSINAHVPVDFHPSRRAHGMSRSCEARCGASTLLYVGEYVVQYGVCALGAPRGLNAARELRRRCCDLRVPLDIPGVAIDNVQRLIQQSHGCDTARSSPSMNCFVRTVSHGTPIAPRSSRGKTARICERTILRCRGVYRPR